MTLVARLSLFFLTALALVLIGMSASIYLIVRSNLTHEFGERFDETFETLTSVAKFGPHGIEWDPTDRRLDFGHDPSGDTAAWQILGADGQSVGLSDEEFAPLFAALPSPASNKQLQQDLPWRGETWRIVRRTVHPEAASSSAADDHPAPSFALIMSVALPLGTELAPLRTLGMTLAGISVTVWLASAIAGKWLCRKALAPVSQMAQTARNISAVDLSQRLPSAITNDELDDLGRAFNDLLDRLQISFQRQQRFTAEASHQLRTPLAAMLGQVDVALRRDRSADEYRRALQSVQRQAEQLKQIIEMLLFLAREDSEAAVPSLERLELRQWVAIQLESWEQHPRVADLRLETSDADAMYISAHAGLLGQAVHNLLDNAFRYSQPGSPVTVRLKANESAISLSVEDRGQGIEVDDLPRVFQPFFRSAAARRRGISGSGLGLAIAQRIAQALRGRLEVQSQPNQGSCFTMVFPKAPSSTTALTSNITPTNVDAAEKTVVPSRNFREEDRSSSLAFNTPTKPR
jgi:heavy metal sensor kinase